MLVTQIYIFRRVGEGRVPQPGLVINYFLLSKAAARLNLSTLANQKCIFLRRPNCFFPALLGLLLTIAAPYELACPEKTRETWSSKNPLTFYNVNYKNQETRLRCKIPIYDRFYLTSCRCRILPFLCCLIRTLQFSQGLRRVARRIRRYCSSIVFTQDYLDLCGL